MILLLDGTSDSRELAIYLKNNGYDLIATATTYEGTNKLIDSNIKTINKKLLYDDLLKRCKKLNINVIIDATHPYAYSIHESALKISEELKILHIRYERPEINYKNKNIVYVDNYEDAAKEALKINSNNILIATGIKNIEYFNGLIKIKNVYFRVLPEYNNIKLLSEMNVKMKNIIAMEGPFNIELNNAIYKNYNIDTLITKDSGFDSESKIKAAIENNIKTVIIKRKRYNYKNIAYNYNDVLNILKGDKNIKP